MNTTMQEKFGRLLKLGIWANTMTYALEVPLMEVPLMDVPLLTDVFENFRKTCLQYYKLDPCHYFTSPVLSWDAMLKMTNIKLELMTDVDMFQFIEKGMRGGVPYIANRYGKANNKYMKEYNKKEPSKYIMYLDTNNLYCWAMSQYLPTGNFKWMSDKEIKKIDLGKYKADGKKGLILEVDLEYPQELHNLHNDYPVAPEKLNVSNNMLSGYCKKIAEEYNILIGFVGKLIPTLKDKKRVCVTLSKSSAVHGSQFEDKESPSSVRI